MRGLFVPNVVKTRKHSCCESCVVGKFTLAFTVADQDAGQKITATQNAVLPLKAAIILGGS